MEKGFIVFEGLDGAGTTTQSKRLEKNLRELNKSVYLTHEPTDNPIGKVVRDVLQHKIETTPTALALLYSADRSDHLYNKNYGLIQKLHNNEIVISDRYFYSTFAYQGANGLDEKFLKDINRYPEPEVIIFLDTPVNECISRIEKRGEEKELFDEANFLNKVREIYIKEFNKLTDTKVLILNGNEEPDVIEKKIWSWIKDVLI